MSRELQFIDIRERNGGYKNQLQKGRQNVNPKGHSMSKKRSRTQDKHRRKGLIRLCILAAVLFLGFVWMIVPKSVPENTSWVDSISDGEIPDSLLQLMEKNPETAQFVMDYPQKKDIHAEIDISGEVNKGEIPLFLQWDERWGYEQYGDDCMALTGCGPTCLSMVYCGLTGDTKWNPYEVARMAEEQGFYVQGSGSAWSLMTDGAKKLGLAAQELVFDESHILAELQAGHPIICIMGPGDFTSAGHFIVLKGVDKNGNILVCDPNSQANSQKAWTLAELMPQIRNLWGYSY